MAETTGGELVIEDAVLDKIAAIAAGQVEGVHSLGRSGLLGAISTVAGGAPGVTSEHGQQEAAFDFDVVVEFGHNIPSVVRAVREAVTDSIETMTNLVTVEVNIHVRDVHHATEPDGRVLN